MKKGLVLLLLFIQLSSIAQNVGIGTTNPSKAKLEVHGAVDATSAIFGGESSGLSLQRNWPGIGFNSYYGNGSHRYLSNGFGALQVVDPTSGYLAFDLFDNGAKDGAVTGRRVMVMTNDGKLSVGSGNTPFATLEVSRGNAPSGTAAFLGTTFNSHINFGALESTHIRAGKSGSVVFVNDIPNGKTVLSKFVSINSTNTYGVPLYINQANGHAIQIHHENTTDWWDIRLNESTLHLDLSYYGFPKGHFAWQDGHYSSVSDRRLKKNVQPLSPLLKRFMQLQAVEYEMTGNHTSKHKSIGFIAQDVKKLFPDLVTVTYDSTHGYKDVYDLHTLNYSGFGVLAVKAIQEQQQIIQELQAQLALLRQAVDALQKKSSGSTTHLSK